MMGRAIVPVAQLGSRLAAHGRIRAGVRAGKAMRALSTWRFTTPDRQAIDQVAAAYGGTVKPWGPRNEKNQFEVITDTNVVRVWLIPNGCDVNYEMWANGGCVRRCDGEMCEAGHKDKDDWIREDVACICAEQDKLMCRPTTRLTVLLPDIRFGGSWRLDSKGWNAAEELPGMASIVAQLQGGAFLEAELALVQRETNGGAKQFIVPALRLPNSAEELVAGEGDVTRRPQLASVPTAGSLPPASGSLRELVESAPSSDPPWQDDDDSIVEAELVDELAEDDDTSEPEGPLVELCRKAMEVDTEAPMIDPDVIVRMLRAQFDYAEVDRKLSGVAGGKAKLVMIEGAIAVKAVRKRR